ncbi:MAG: glutamate--tRNA ligase, partial [Pseudobdellovibrionaceae bacterium]
MSKFPEVRVRFAPSPTGYLHVGGARTALYNYLFAKKNNGKFILRVEDTDEVRSTDESLKMVLKDLEWLGLKWDEGPNPATLGDMGPYGPYKQSQRKSIYAEVAQDLLSRGLGYYCFLTDAEIDMQRQAAIAANKPPHISSPYESWPLEKAQAEIKSGKTAVVRFKTKQFKKDFVLRDLVRGDVRFPSDMVGDFVMLRSDGMPVYNFCCAVDDHSMKISHVLRAEEHLPNTLRQLMIYEAMGWDIPQFGHISLVLDDDRQKLSKRKGAVSCDQFKNDGYFPHALLNFIALLIFLMLIVTIFFSFS